MNDDVIDYVRQLEQRVAVLESELQSRVHAEAEDKRQAHLRELTGPLFGAAAAFDEGRRSRA
jgi:uncharacterized small protein (DUF1192 family)